MCAGPVSLATTNLLLFIKPASSEIEIALSSLRIETASNSFAFSISPGPGAISILRLG